jgi:hypothetical protein
MTNSAVSVLTPDQKKVFIEVGYAVDNMGGAKKESIIVIGKRKEERDQYLSIFCQLGLCNKMLDESYVLTGKGLSVFESLKSRREREGTTSSAVSGGSYKGY